MDTWHENISVGMLAKPLYVCYTVRCEMWSMRPCSRHLLMCAPLLTTASQNKRENQLFNDDFSWKI